MVALENADSKIAFQENSVMYKLSKGALFGYKNSDGIHLKGRGDNVMKSYRIGHQGWIQHVHVCKCVFWM